jgi:Fic family protein
MSTAIETPYRLEPTLLESYPVTLGDTIAELVRVATALGSRLHPTTGTSLADLVRVMNCYYSNLIEGHNARPRDIERALANQLEADHERRDLQLEARAHIRVQSAVDAMDRAGTLGEPAQEDHIRWLHRSFYEGLPSSMLRVHHERGDFHMVPGEFRNEPKHDNAVGRHLPPSSERVSEFMAYFASRYRLEQLGTASRVIAMAAAHHRFNYIHPFSDGNGRVSRLMSHGMALKAGIGAHGLWSISRGLARGLGDAGEYKRMMDAADAPRRGDLDGRGNLSLEALLEFVSWFCKVALDQVRFMSEVFDLDRIEQRLRAYVTGTLTLPDDAAQIVAAVLRHGELPRGEAASVAHRPDRSARLLVSRLVESGILTSATAKGPLRLQFGVASAEHLFPRLFPAQQQG